MLELPGEVLDVRTGVVQRADRALRRRALWFVLCAAVAGGAALVAGLRAVPHLEAWLLSDYGLLEQRLLLLASALSLLLGAPLLVAAVHLWRRGARVCAASRFPLGDERVLSDTPTLEGHAARRRGRAMQALGAVLAVAAVMLALVLWRLALSLVAFVA